jgi:hypothetical protein
MKRLITLVSALVLVPTLALAQPSKTPDEWYKEGETQYNLGNFQGAVDAFKKGFELEPNESKKAAYLYNVAQAYRQAKDCTNAQFFYKRYLALKDNDTKKPLKAEKRKEIEDRIQELDECAKQQEVIRQKPPGDIGDEPKPEVKPEVKPDPKVVGDAGDGDGDGDGEDGDGGGITKGTETTQPKLLSVRAFGGGAKISTGDLEVPVQATFGLIAGYPLAINEKLILDIGAGFTFTPVPYETMGMSKSAKMIGLVADVGVTYAVAPKIGLRGDVGAGVLFFSGVSESPFTDGQATTGALSMFHLRVGLSGDYAVTPNFLITLTPIAFSYSPAHKGLRDDIKSITAIDFMLGLGYRM